MKRGSNKKRWIVGLGLLSVGLIVTAYLATGTQLFAQEEPTMGEETVVTDEPILPSILRTVGEEGDEEEADIAENVTEGVLISEEEEEQARILAEITDPEVRTTTNVSTWEQFRTAINTNSVTVINVTASISGNTSLNNINRSLTINGNGNTINSQSQRYLFIGANRQFRINNATLVASNSGTTALISTGTGASNFDVIFTSVNYAGNRLVGPTSSVNDIGLRSVLFDGGVSNMASNTSSIVAARSVRIANNARVNHSGISPLSNNLTENSISFQNNMEFILDAGSTLISSREGLVLWAASVTINGYIESGPIEIPPLASVQHTVSFGSESQSIISNRGSSSVFGGGTVGADITIASGATFDFINTDGGSLLGNTRTGITTIQGNTERLALWNLRTQNNDFASLAFSDIQYNLRGATAQAITSTNSESFRTLYATQGLAAYSRMRSTGQTQITVQAQLQVFGAPTTSRRLMDPGEISDIKANPNVGYRFARWVTLSGGGIITDDSAEDTTFTMGNQTTVLRAEYNQIRSLTLQSSPVEGGNPTSGSNSLITGESTSLSANPNPGYTFSRWEIVSGVGAVSINNVTSPTATFTMGGGNTVVRAIYEENVPGKVHVHHLDTEGHELAGMETLTGVIGDAYTTEPKEIEGYRLVETPANASGIFANELISVTYVYDADPTEAVLTIEFVNETNQVLSDYTMTLDRMIGDQIDLEEEPEVLAQIDTVLNAGYEIIERPETPVYLEQAQVTVQYRVQGVLRLASAPDVVDFGSLTYNAQTQRVEDPDFDEDLVVADTRAGTTSGWTMTASLSSPLMNEDGNELVNALRYVSQGQERILSQFDQPIYTNTSGSAGVFNISDMWGTDSQTDGLKLQIDRQDDVFTGRYTGVIIWKVMAGQP